MALTRRTALGVAASAGAGTMLGAGTVLGTAPVTYTVDTGSARAFQGQQFTPAARNTNLTDKTGPVLTLPQFWIERL